MVLLRWLTGLCLLAACIEAGSAGASSLHEAQNGLWGRDGCADSSAYFYASGDLYLNLYKQEDSWVSLLSRPVSQRTTETHIIEQYRYGEAFYVYYSWFEGGRLSSASAPEASPTEQKIDSLPDLPPDDYAIQHYERCERLPADVYFTHAEGARFMELVDALRRTCSHRQPACIERAFAAVDVSRDGRLSVAEVSRVLRIVVYAAVAANPEGAREQDLASALGLASLLGPLISTAIISGSDYDGDGQLTRDEIFYDRDIATVQHALEAMSLDEVGATMSAIFQGMAGIPGLF